MNILGNDHLKQHLCFVTFKMADIFCIIYDYTSARPEVRGTAVSDGGAYSPFRSILLVLTHDFIIICVYGPTCSDGHEWMVPTRMLVAHHFWPFEVKGVLYAWSPVQPANGPPTRTTSG